MTQHWRTPMNKLINTNLSASHPGWILVMVGGFIVWWPVGLLVLAYILWSTSMGRVNGMWLDRVKATLGLSHGNAAFEAHKAATLRDLEKQRQRLADQEREFAVYMDRVRMAKDKSDFDRFMGRAR